MLRSVGFRILYNSNGGSFEFSPTVANLFASMRENVVAFMPIMYSHASRYYDNFKTRMDEIAQAFTVQLVNGIKFRDNVT